MSEKTTTTGRSKTAVAIDRILEMIEGSSLKPGDRLPSERALAADLRVSRATVREAIMALQIAGRLESRSGDGTYILERPINIGDDETKLRAGVDITEALEYRMAIEISASIMACRRARKSDIMRMQAVLEAMAEFVADFVAQNQGRLGLPPEEAHKVAEAFRRVAGMTGSVITWGYDHAVSSALFEVAGMPEALLARLRDAEIKDALVGAREEVGN